MSSNAELSLFQEVANGGNEPGGRRAIEGPMVPCQTQSQYLSLFDPSLFVPSGLVPDPSYAQHSSVGRVDDRRKAINPKHPKGCDGKSAAFDIREFKLSASSG